MIKFSPELVFTVLIVGVIALSYFAPYILAENTFLDDFVGAQLLSLLSVILTITLASVANIHLALNRIISRQFVGREDEGREAAEPVRDEIESNGWYLFWSFILCIFLLFLEGMFGEYIWVESAVYGFGLLILILNVWVLYDIYTSVYDLVKADTNVTEQTDTT